MSYVGRAGELVLPRTSCISFALLEGWLIYKQKGKVIPVINNYNTKMYS
jgi:hypothetical protein